MEFFLLVGSVIFCGLLSRRVTALERKLEIMSVAASYRPPNPASAVLVFFACLIGLVGSISHAQELVGINSMALAPETRAYCRNPDGSCVQCSIQMTGFWCNDPNAGTLLFDTAYGPAERGGSWPSRVEAYLNKRGIKAWSVTGNSVNDTLPWLEFSAKTGRFAAFGAGEAHFQTLYGRDVSNGYWYVCNNNSTDRIDRYTDAQFRQLHAAGPCWCVILEKPSSSPPRLDLLAAMNR